MGASPAIRCFIRTRRSGVCLLLPTPAAGGAAPSYRRRLGADLHLLRHGALSARRRGGHPKRGGLAARRAGAANALGHCSWLGLEETSPLHLFAATFGWQQQHPELFTATDPVANVAVLFSAQTRDAYQGYDDAHYVNAWHGWCQELALANVPYDVLLDADLTASRLRLPRPVAAERGLLSERQMEAIERFVRDGERSSPPTRPRATMRRAARAATWAWRACFGVRCRGILTPRPASIALRGAPVGGIDRER